MLRKIENRNSRPVPEQGRSFFRGLWSRSSPPLRSYTAAFIAVLLAETVSMVLVMHLPDTGPLRKLGHDLLFLSIFAAPLLFVTLYLPLDRYVRRTQQADASLRDAVGRRQNTVRELTILSELLGFITTEDEPYRLLESMALRVRDLVPSEEAAILLFGDRPGVVGEYVTSGGGRNEPGKGGWLLQDAFTDVRDGIGTARLGVEEVSLLAGSPERLRNAMIVPLISEDRVSGLLALMNRKSEEYDQGDEDTILNFAFHAYQAIRIHGELARLATMDGLTGLVNHRVFHERLTSEVARCVRYPTSSVSLIMLDIDRFKRFNDTYGHQTGDAVLRQLSETIRQMVRGVVDIPARYGGEEFAVILPETSRDQAVLVARRLRAEVDRRGFSSENGERVSLTISAGVASCPLDAKDSPTLVRLADAALYEAKKSGRNRVCAAMQPTAN